MNCHEIRSYFEASELGTGRRELAATVGQHLRTCSNCARDFQTQIELLGILNLVRDSAPATSASLDAAVLQNFRRRTAHISTPKALASFRRPVATLLWRGAIAAVIVLAAIVLLAYRRSAPKPPIEAVRLAPLASPQGESDPVQPIISNSTASKSAPASPHPNRRSARNATQASALAANRRIPQPVDFNGLMYCDSLTCSEDMEIIRMQLPAPPAQSPDAAAQNPVYADVIVGPDGIARGYRIVR